jgi:tetratricopeptide (TPR) repeat protein
MNFKLAKTKYPVIIPTLIIVLIAIVIRMLYYIFELNNPLFLYPIIDESEFIHIAKIIAANNFYNPEHFWHPPFYTWFLTFFFKIGIGLNGIVLFQLLMGVAGSVILYLGLRKLNPKAALIASLIWAVYPVELFTETRFLSENLYTFLSICLLFQLTRFEINYKKILYVSIITSFLILTKSQFTLFLLFFFAYLIIKQKKLSSYALMFLSVSMILPIIVSINNTKKANGSFMFISSNGPINLYIGNSSDINKTLNIRPYEWGEKFFPGLYNEAGIKFTVKDTSEETYYPYKLSGFLTRKTISDNLNPLIPIKNLFIKTFGLLYSQETPRNYDLYIYKQFNPLLNICVWKFPFYFPLALIFYAGILLIIIKRKILFKTKPWFWLIVLLIIHILPSIIFFNAFRYRLPAIPILLFFAVIFYTEYFRNMKYQIINILLILVLGTQITSAFQIQKIPLYESYNTIGKSYLKKGKPERAGIWFRKAQLHLPKNGMSNNYDTYKGSAQVKEKAGDLQGALSDLNIAVEKNPTIEEAYLYRASILYKLSDFESAIRDYNQAISLNQGNKENLQNAIYGKALSRAKMNDNQTALLDFDSVISLFPSYSEAYTNRGIIYAKLGKFTEALSDLDKSISLNSKDEKPYFNRAGVYASMGNLKKALNDLNEAIKIKPDYSEVYYMRGRIFLQSNDHVNACSDFKKAYNLGYSSAKQDLETYCK